MSDKPLWVIFCTSGHYNRWSMDRVQSPAQKLINQLRDLDYIQVKIIKNGTGLSYSFNPFYTDADSGRHLQALVILSNRGDLTEEEANVLDLVLSNHVVKHIFILDMDTYCMVTRPHYPVCRQSHKIGHACLLHGRLEECLVKAQRSCATPITYLFNGYATTSAATIFTLDGSTWA